MKNLVAISVASLLCVSLVVTSGLASEYTLKIFGNANMDEVIDEADIEYVRGIIEGTNEVTELADANYDGVVNEDDITQIEQIIDGVEKELWVIDCVDRIVTVKKPIRRIIVCQTSAFETLRSLKVPTDMIVGLAKLNPSYDPSGFYPEIGDIADVGARWTPDIEQILSLQPDFVILSGGSNFKVEPTVDALESAGISVLCTHLNRLEDYREEVEVFGYIFDKEKEAAELLDWRDNILDSIEETVEQIPEEDKPRVYFETTSYKTYGIHANIALTGGQDIFADLQGEGSYVVDPEAVIERNPDIIVKVGGSAVGYDLDAGNTSELEAIRYEIMSRSELQNVNAVMDGKVYIINDRLLGFWGNSGCRNFLQIAYQAKWFHPEFFEDLDPKAIHQEYLTRFQGLDINLDENGVFVYPLEETT